MVGTEVFLFAHPDDEFGAFLVIEQAVRRGAPVHCVYLTDGAFQGQSSSRREAESRGVLARLGVEAANIHFIGGREGYPDGRLVHHLEAALQAIATVLDPLAAIQTIHMHAWEGGHQDHDAGHLLGLAYAARRGLLGACRQFPLYRVGPGLLDIAVCAPLADNGPVESRRIPWGRRLAYLSLCLAYRSQAKSFLYLLPALALHYAMKGTQDLQPVDPARVVSRPHEGPLLYEHRGVDRHDDFREVSHPFTEAFVFGAGQPGTGGAAAA